MDVVPDNAGLETLPISEPERAELERRMAEYPEDDAAEGRTVDEIMAELRHELWRGAGGAGQLSKPDSKDSR